MMLLFYKESNWVNAVPGQFLGEGSEFVLKQSQPKFSIKHLLRA